MYFLITVGCFTVVVGLGLLILRPVFAQYVDSYAMRVRSRKAVLADGLADTKTSGLITTYKAIGKMVLGVLPQLADKRTTTLLQYADYRTPDHMAIYIGIKVVVVGMAILLTIMTSGGDIVHILFAFPLALCAWMIPNFWLAARGQTRQTKIVEELPAVLDLLIVCAQAGLGLLMCIDKVSKETGETCPVLSQELKQLINDIKMFAKPIPHAFAELAERCGVQELTSVTGALVAAETKGADISYPLKQQSEALRDKLKRKKEEEAAKIPVKMVPVIMFFIMPLVLCPMLGPAVIAIMSSLGSITGGK